MFQPTRHDPAEHAGHTTPALTHAGPAPARKIPSKDAPAALAAAILSELNLLNATTSQLAARVGGQILNDVLDSRMVTLDADGIAALEYRVGIGSVVVANHNAAGNVTVSAGPRQGAAPGGGRGVHLVRPGIAAAVPIGSRTVTLYGTAGNSLSVQVFGVRLAPFSGPC